MLLESYRAELFRPECNPNFESLHCHAHLDQDVSQALPYLNARLGGFEFSADPPSLTLRAQGKLITLHPRLIAVNALKDSEEAQKILDWLQREINQAWDDRASIEPSYESAPRPKLLEVLKLLPKTNCGECGQATCMVFAAQLVEGGRWIEDCTALDEPNAQSLRDYLGPYFNEES